MLPHVLHPSMLRFAEVAAGAAIAGLWQGVVLAAAAWLLLRLLPETPASARFAVWIAVFVAAAAMPLARLFGGSASGTVGPVAQMQVDARWSYLLAGLWVGSVSIRLVMLAVQTACLREIWKSAVPVVGAAFDDLLVGRKVQVCTSRAIDRPSVIGFLAPRILIPDWLFAQLTDVELRHIVLHEMEHLRRRDDWVNLLQKVGLVLFPLDPALFWIDRKLSAEREIACDDGVLERTRMPRAYAESLTSIAERRLGMRLNRRVMALALGATGVRPQSEFARRIETILGRRAAVRPAVAGGLAAVLMVAILGAGVEMVRAPELLSFAPEKPQNGIASVSVRPEIGESAGATRFQPPAEFRNASFRVSQPVSRPVVLPQTKSHVRKAIVPLEAKVEAISGTQPVTVKSVSPVRRQGQLMVLTTWEQPTGEQGDGDEVPVSRVVVKTPDGRFYATPYAAVPTQAGWLIVQL